MIEEEIDNIIKKYGISVNKEDNDVKIELIHQKLSSSFYLTIEEEQEVVDILIRYHKHKQKIENIQYTEIVRILQEENLDIESKICPILNESFYKWIQNNKDKVNETFDKIVKTTRIKKYDLFGWKTLYKSYLLRTNNGVIEAPDHLWYRIALFVHQDDWDFVEKMFIDLRNGNYIHATPSLYSAGVKYSQMASCFLLGIEDSVEEIYDTVKNCALISKWAGGIGIHLSNIRGKNSYIRGTNGRSNGLMPLLKVLNDTSRYIDQCFSRDTFVLTDRGYIPIGDIIEGKDSVWTLNGNYRKVKKKLIHEVSGDEIYKVKYKTPWGNEYSTRMTNTHDLYWKNNSGEYIWENLSKAGKGWLTCYKSANENKDTKWKEYDEKQDDFFLLGYIYRYIDYSTLTIQYDDTEIGKGLETFLEKYSIEYIKTNDLIQIDSLGIWDIWFHNHPNLPYSLLYRIPSLCLQYFFYGWTCRINADIENDPQIIWFLHHWNRDFNFQYGEIIEIEKENGKNTENMYDLEIEDEPNYQTILGIAHNGGGKRMGAFSVYIEPWHCDIYSFIYAKKNVGVEEDRARDLFYALWIPDYFMECVEKNLDWYLMSPDESPGLNEVWGYEFVKLYKSYIEKKLFRKKILARELWVEILKIQIETGTPYILYKDTVNKSSNHNHLGTICSSNLCCEIMEYSTKDEYAVCNLASISLPSCLDTSIQEEKIIIIGKSDCFYCKLLLNMLQERNWTEYEYYDKETILTSKYANWKLSTIKYPQIFTENGLLIGGFQDLWEKKLCPKFDFDKLGRLVKDLVRNINKIIDKTYYPIDKCKISNLKNRPMGIGVQGLADVYFAMLLPYNSINAKKLNSQIFEYIYYNALEESMIMSKNDGKPFDTFSQCQLSKGILHFDHYDLKYPLSISDDKWNNLRINIQNYGIKNSLLIALMPTASTSQILSNTESFEPLTNNFYLRRTSAGEFYVINRFLKKILMGTNLWDTSLIDSILLNKGSIQHLECIPSQIKEIFKTVWELSTKDLIESAHDRQCFIDQSQSFNIYLTQPSTSLLNKIHFYTWKNNLKTGSYYIRSKSIVSSQPIALSKECLSCSS